MDSRFLFVWLSVLGGGGGGVGWGGVGWGWGVCVCVCVGGGGSVSSTVAARLMCNGQNKWPN